MSNMSYCRFYNTVSDLKDCHANMEESVEGEEAVARLRLIQLCISIANDYADEVGADGQIETNQEAFYAAIRRTLDEQKKQA